VLDSLRYALRSLLRRARVERELEEEIAGHVKRETQKNIDRGMPPTEARRVALLAFGGREQLKEAHRDARGARWLEDCVADARYAVRALGHNPALALTAIVTLALGIGANTAIYSAVNAVLLRPLPFKEPERLVMVGENNREFLWHMADAAPANYLDWRAGVPAFRDVMAYADYPVSVTLMVDGTPELAPTAMVTGNFFSVLGVEAQVGRTFRDDETWSTAAPVVVMSDRLWRNKFRGDRAIVGKTISVNGSPATVVGVAPPTFAFPQRWFDLWTPIGWQKDHIADVSFRRAHWLRVIARLAPGVSAERASVQLRSVAERLKVEYPETNRIMEAELAPLHQFLVGDTRLPLLVLLGAVGLLLLIACANVGNLLLVRAGNRQREVAVRAALGASRSRLMRQAFTESLVLSLIGGAAGLLAGWWGIHALTALQPGRDGLLPVSAIEIDWHVATFVLGVSFATGMLFGIAPALWASYRAPHEAMTAGGAGRAGSPGVRIRRWGERLAVAEVAIALSLTVAAGLLVRSFENLQRVDPGFDPHNVVAATMELPPSRYDTDARVRGFFDELVSRAQTLPGVEGAAAATHLPLTYPGWSSDFSLDGPSAGHFGATLVHRQVTPDYFRVMRVRVLRGRVFTSADRGPPYVVVINEAFARQYFAGQDPIGQHIAFDRVPTARSTWRTIVGVVGSEHQATAATPPAIEAIAPFGQEDSRQMSLVVRARADATPLSAAIRQIVATMDPELAIESIRPMTDVRAESMARDRFLMTLLSMFGLIGLVLAVVGVYGIIAQLARGRTREMGIRIALGAGRPRVQWLIVRRGLVLATVGVCLGGAATAVGTRALARLLYGVSPGDPLTYGVVAVALVGAGAIASWLPAWRAGRVDPVSVLREE
jgi:putative ABC transport system permease protein